MITTTVPWIVWARLGQSTLRSSAIDSEMKLPRRRCSCSTGATEGPPAVAGCGVPPRGSLERRLACGAARVAALPAGLVGHQRVSRCPCGCRTSGSTS